MLSPGHYYCTCASTCASFNFQHRVFPGMAHAIDKRGPVKHTARQTVQRAARLPPTFSTQLHIPDKLFTRLKPKCKNRAELHFTLGHRENHFSYLCCSYREKLSVRGRAGVRGMPLRYSGGPSGFLQYQTTEVSS